MFESNNANNIMQEEQSFEFLDVLAIVSFMAQINNMNKDVKETQYIHKVIKTIGNEIAKLHYENDIIMEQNETIIKILKDIGVK